MTAPAGWYPDPDPSAASGGMRWWDGGTWTTAVRSAAYPPPAWSGANPHSDLAAERRLMKPAGWATVAYAAATIVSIGFDLATVLRVHADAVRFLDANGFAPGLAWAAREPRVAGAVPAEIVVAVVQIVAVVWFLRWLYRAARMAEGLLWPARHSPGMAVGCWFIPVVNFWFPYQAVRDCLPEGHPARQAVKRWWAIHIARSVVGLLRAILGYAIAYASSDRVSVLAVLLAIEAALTVAWVVWILPIMRAIGESHSNEVMERYGEGPPPAVPAFAAQ